MKKGDVVLFIIVGVALALSAIGMASLLRDRPIIDQPAIQGNQTTEVVR